MIRFPPAQSDPISLRDTFREGICRAFEEKSWPSDGLDHDSLADAAVSRGIVTSGGQIGQDALTISFREDRSRDAVYNQMKMLTELYRLLGWLMPVPSGRDRFLVTPLGHQAAAFSGAEFDAISTSDGGILSERDFWEHCLLNVCFPHPHTSDKSGLSQRTFVLILELVSRVTDIVTRDELILTALHVRDDKDGQQLGNCISAINRWRASNGAVSYSRAKRQLIEAGGIVWSTMGNYTRFPLRVMQDVGWFKKIPWIELSDRQQLLFQNELGEKAARRTHAYLLTERGQAALTMAHSLVDIRQSDLPLEKQDALALLTILITASRKERVISRETANSLSPGAAILRDLGISTSIRAGRLRPIRVLFEPFQQLPSSILVEAISLVQGH